MNLAPWDEQAQRAKNGRPWSRAHLYVYLHGTEEEVGLYADSAGATPLTQPLVSDSEGRYTKDSDGNEFVVFYAEPGVPYDKLCPEDTVNGRVPFIIPGHVTGAMTWKGAWDPTTNTPHLEDGTGTSGDTYRVTAPGTRDLGSGDLSVTTNDELVYDGETWQAFPAGSRGVVNVDDYLPVYETHTEAIEAAQAAAATAALPLRFGEHYVITDPDEDGVGLTVDIARDRWLGELTQFDCTGLPAESIAIKVTKTYTPHDGGLFGESPFNFQSFRIYGPTDPAHWTDADLARVGIKMEAATGHDAARFPLRDVSVSNFGAGVEEGSNSYCFYFDGGEVFANLIGYRTPDGTNYNAGERQVFSGTSFFENAIDVGSFSHYSDTYLDNVSLDYSFARPGVTPGNPAIPSRCKIWAYAGLVRGVAHCEDAGYSDYWFITGPNPSARIEIGGRWHLGTDKAADGIPLGYSDPASGGIALMGVDPAFTTSRYRLGKLIGGGGPVEVSHLGYQPNPELVYPGPVDQPPVSDSLCPIDGSFETSDLGSWDLSYSTSLANRPALATDQFHSGSKSLKFACPGGEGSGFAQATLWFNVTPGEKALLSYWLKTAGGLTAAKKFSCQWTAFNASLTRVIAQATKDFTADADWALQVKKLFVVPPQASLLALSFFSSNNQWDAAQRAWVDDLIVNVVG